MRKIALSILFVFISGFGFSQYQRDVQIKPFIDTTTTEFKNIFKLWEDYMDTLMIYSVNNHFKIKKTNESINSFWTEYDVQNYSFPDLTYSVISSTMAFYPMEKEYFLGFACRDTNLYELKSMFVNSNEDIFHNTPDLIISQPILRKDNTYRLYNKFTLLLKTNKIIENRLSNISYYYSTLYDFNINEAETLNARIEEFKKGFKISQKKQISYLVGDNITEIYSWFGIDYVCIDYNAALESIEGRAVPLNNMILSGGGGENYMHEIIHILLNGYRKGKYNYFEEGIACYFGEHVGNDYLFHVKRLKQYLKNNEWIDLSKNMEFYYKNAEVSHSYAPLNKDNPVVDHTLYGDGKTNFTYIINAVIVDIAFRKGGYELVRKILMEKADNGNEFYSSIEKYLGIPRKNIDKEINEYLIKYY